MKGGSNYNTMSETFIITSLAPICNRCAVVKKRHGLQIGANVETWSEIEVGKNIVIFL